MTTACIYARYSFARQQDECESIEFQTDTVRKYFAYQGIEVGEVISDPATSARLIPLHKRKGGAKLLELTTGRRPQYQVVGSYRMDRLWRDVVDGMTTLKIWKRGDVSVHFAAEGGQSLNTSTAIGEFLITVLLAKGALEPALTSERTSAAMLRHISNGRRMGSQAPYGMMESGGRWVDSPEEQAVIQRVLKMHEAGLSLRAIAARLESDGVPSRRGAVWAHGTIKSIVRRAMTAV